MHDQKDFATVDVFGVECENIEDVKAVLSGYLSGECAAILRETPESSVHDLVKTVVNGTVDELAKIWKKDND